MRCTRESYSALLFPPRVLLCHAVGGPVSATTTASGEQGGAVLVCGFDEDEPGEHTDEAESDEDDESCDSDCPLSREGKQGEQG